MVTAVTSNPKQRSSQNQKRPPLLPSDSDNAQPRRPRGREVTSRYLSLSTSSSSSSNSSNTTSSSNTSGSWSSSISSRRSQSPMVSSRAAMTTPKSSVKERAMSAERRPPAAATTPSNAQRMLTTSMRSLSVSFQGESYSLPVSKVKPPPTSAGTPLGFRKGTPERRKAGVTPVMDKRDRDRENSRPSDQQQHLWPGRLRGDSSSVLTRSLDYGCERAKLSGSGAALKALRKSMAGESSDYKVGVQMKNESESFEIRGMSELHSRSSLGDRLNSDGESVSSESTASGRAIPLRGPSGIVAPAKFWQEVNTRGHKLLDPTSPVSNNALNRPTRPSKLIVVKKILNDIPVSSPREVFASRGLSPLRGVVRTMSPNKALTSSTGALLRGMASPTRSRSGVGNSMNDNNPCNTPSMLSFAADVRKGKLGENRIADAHDLRLLYNRQLQWRLGNAMVENVLLVQKHTAERSLSNAWVSTSKLRHSVKSKRTKLQLLRHNLKLYSILKEQEPHLEDWGLFDRDHLNSLSGAIVALEASTIRLPVVGGARADVQMVEEAISSAVDLMQAMASSIRSSLTKVEQMSLLVSELSSLSAREHGLLDECKDFLSTTFIPLQVMHCSLRTHALQVQCVPASLTMKVLHN